MITINRTNGDTFEFSAPSRHVYLSINNGRRMQICRGGKFLGETLQLSNRSDHAELAAQVSRWMRAYRKAVCLS